MVAGVPRRARAAVSSGRDPDAGVRDRRAVARRNVSQRARRGGQMVQISRRKFAAAAIGAALLALVATVAPMAQTPTQNSPAAALQRDPLTPAPNRAQGEGFGPYKTMVIRGAVLIDGTGGPPRGPVDIVVNDNRITQIRNAGTPGLPLRTNRGPKGDYEIDA